MTPRVSVIMPAFNCERYIAQAMTSVLRQTDPDLELIVVDDGSTDSTLEIARALAAEDARVVIVPQRNSGRPAIARNAGLEAARGKHLSFLDADDSWEPERLELLVGGIEAHPEWVAVFHDMQYVEESGQPMREKYLADSNFPGRAIEFVQRVEGDWYECGERFFVFMHLKFAAIHTNTILIARDRTPIRPIRFDTRFVCCEDTDLWLRLARRQRIGYLDRTLASYRQHGAGISRRALQMALDVVRVHEQGFDQVQEMMSPEERRAYRAKIGQACEVLAYRHSLSGAQRESRQAYLRSLSWRLSAEAAVGYAKCWLPASVVRLLRGRSDVEHAESAS